LRAGGEAGARRQSRPRRRDDHRRVPRPHRRARDDERERPSTAYISSASGMVRARLIASIRLAPPAAGPRSSPRAAGGQGGQRHRRLPISCASSPRWRRSSGRKSRIAPSAAPSSPSRTSTRRRAATAADARRRRGRDQARRGGATKSNRLSRASGSCDPLSYLPGGRTRLDNHDKYRSLPLERVPPKRGSLPHRRSMSNTFPLPAGADRRGDDEGGCDAEAKCEDTQRH
jgi:hypothetical protein